MPLSINQNANTSTVESTTHKNKPEKAPYSKKKYRGKTVKKTTKTPATPHQSSSKTSGKSILKRKASLLNKENLLPTRDAAAKKQKRSTQSLHQTSEIVRQSQSLNPALLQPATSPEPMESVDTVQMAATDTVQLEPQTVNTETELIIPHKDNIKDQFSDWKNFLKTTKPKDDKQVKARNAALVNELFGKTYPSAEKSTDKNALSDATEQITRLLDKPDSNLSRLMDSLLYNWEKTVAPADANALRTAACKKLAGAWQRMSEGDMYKLQAVVEGLYLQTAGGHPPSSELDAFIENSVAETTRFRDGMIYDGTNAIDPNNPHKVTQSKKKMIAVESAYAYEASPKQVVRKEPSGSPDISLSNFGNSKITLESNLKNTRGDDMPDSVAFSDGTYTFHGPSIEMDDRDDTIKAHLKPGTDGSNGLFAARIKGYINDHTQKGRPLEELTIAGDLNLYLFDDNAETGERTLKSGVQEILNDTHMALVIPSGQVTRGRPVSDQLHKNLEAGEAEGQRDTMIMMVPVTPKNHGDIIQLGQDSALKQDTFFPSTNINGQSIETTPIIHKLPEPRKQFSMNPDDRIITDHAMLTSPRVILGNTADCFGVSSAPKSLEVKPEKKAIWGDTVPSAEQYHKLMGNSAEIITTFMQDLSKNSN
ncbi:hypothetical protein CI610_03518 [invertebrate metagenome]|uniref:Uncharacterized protein n=1 Tax=invertebrate metagenome TaxID=1711999 RepID=A0A2H9T2V2_9ZZZZ